MGRAEWFSRADMQIDGAVTAVGRPDQPAFVAAQRLDGVEVVGKFVLAVHEAARHRFPLPLHLRRIVAQPARSEEHTSELQSLMRISYAVFCLNKKKEDKCNTNNTTHKISTSINNHNENT